MIIEKNRALNPAFVEIAGRHGVALKAGASPEEAWRATQEKWYDRGAIVFKHLGEAEPTAEESVLLDALHLTEEIRAPITHWRAVLLLGGRLWRVRDRLECLLKYHMIGGMFSTIYLMSGDRELNPEFESMEQIAAEGQLKFKPGWKPGAVPGNELKMVEAVIDQSELPAGWNFKPVFASKKADGRGGMRPPNTGDTFDALLADEPEFTGGPALVVYSQPFQYQLLTAKRHLGKERSRNVFGIAQRPKSGTTMKEYLDSIAKLLHEEILILKTKP